jgi:hypothetical protein
MLVAGLNAPPRGSRHVMRAIDVCNLAGGYAKLAQVPFLSAIRYSRALMVTNDLTPQRQERG